jgi:hypothetical protein
MPTDRGLGKVEPAGKRCCAHRLFIVHGLFEDPATEGMHAVEGDLGKERPDVYIGHSDVKREFSPKAVRRRNRSSCRSEPSDALPVFGD